MYDGTYIVSNPIIAYRSTLDQSRETWSSKIDASCDSLVPYYIYYYYRIKNIVINIVITINYLLLVFYQIEASYCARNNENYWRIFEIF